MGVKFAVLPALAGLLLTASPAGAQGPSCSTELGAQRARILAERCIAVSPATHPPCNASNACALILGEIRRSCALFPAGDADRPAWCREYPGP